MKYYALTVNPLNVKRTKEEIDDALERWLSKANAEKLWGTYELAGRKLHYHTIIKCNKMPYLKKCRIPGYQIYLGGLHTERWERYIAKEKHIEDEAIFQHHCQNNYLF